MVIIRRPAVIIIEQPGNSVQTLDFLERCARVCYQTESKKTIGSSCRLLKKIWDKGHFSIFEHVGCGAKNLLQLCREFNHTPIYAANYGTFEQLLTMLSDLEASNVIGTGYNTYKIVCSRACAQQLTRHRLASYAMESTRRVNYSNGLNIVLMPNKSKLYQTCVWLAASVCFWVYLLLLALKLKPEEARMILPLCTKTEIIMTATPECWLYIAKMRARNKHAEEEIRVITDFIEQDIVLRNKERSGCPRN